ncbi:hypothetical protein [Methylobacterium soli]|uniref:Uncharacterized protein n=1 Tax=Methylobacterium soli TaxID=553447 RepID=A0A6L3SZ16_9HYPH|nr:hypothetical protein [Methylobacterium soli]KAB1077893.1 hypothetical protein F6X53_16935 [Methylobacterium soli]GJE42085.1 hypothetical protein AEGHOMDF_1256 [Methylobacterium soli]
MKTLGIAVAVAALGCLAGIQAAEAAHCRPGKYYRPSRGVCVTEAAFRRDVRHVSHQRASRHAGRRAERVRVVYVERPVPVYVERAAPRPAQTAEAVAPAPVVAAAAIAAAPVAVATQNVAPVAGPVASAQQVAAVQAGPAPAASGPAEAEIRTIAAIPFQAVGQQSLNPLPPRTRGWEWSR